MKRLMILFVALSGMLAVSCEKVARPMSGSLADEKHTLTVRVVTDGIRIKALNSDDIPITDGLHRLDLYIFHENEPMLDEHIVLEPDVSGITTCTLKEKKGEYIGVLAIGNLDEDTAELLEGKTLKQLNNELDPEAWIILSANNFATDRIIMVGANSYRFTNDGSVEIELRRLMYRIDVGKITVAPENSELQGKEIFIKNLALINVCNYFVPLKSYIIGHFYTWYLFFGNEYNLTNAFGGIERGFEHYTNTSRGWDANGSFAMEGPGKLNSKFPYLINSNYEKDPGVLNIDATGVLKDATHHEFDNVVGEGLIVPSGSMEYSHSLKVGKCFYGFMGRGTYDYDIVSDYQHQTYCPKLVIELSIDGVSWFYPIPLMYPQPNTVYRIDNITIKDYGSEYSNFFPLKYLVDYSISLSPWEEQSIDNMNVGADPITGEVVDLYN